MRIIMLIGMLALATAAEAQVQKWQVAQFQMLSSGYGYTFDWQSPNGSFIMGDLEGIFNKMSCPVPRERSLNIGDALNCIGMNGWELVSVVADGDGKVYYFKRPLR